MSDGGDQDHASISNTPCLPLPFSPLQDDLDCVDRLSRGDEGYQHLRLSFLWNILYRGCSRNHNLTVDTWLEVIEGSEGLDDLWMWEDGDEEWLRANIKRPTFSRDYMAQITPQDWEKAGLALQSRLSHRRNRVVIHDTPSNRVRIIGWRLLVSRSMANANMKRGIAARRDSALDVREWYTCVHDLFYFFNLNHDELRATFFPSLRGDHHQCATDMGMVREWAMMMSKLYPQDEFVAICKNMCGCDACANRIGETTFFHPDHFFGEFPFIEPALPSASSGKSVTGTFKRPPVSLVLSWILYEHALLDSDVEPTITPLLMLIESASIDDLLDLWSLADDKEEWLEHQITTGHPDESYLSWINDYPESWRESISLLTSNDWQDLHDAITKRRNAILTSNVTSTRRPLSFPQDARLWIGALLWILLDDLSGMTYHSPVTWFDAWDDSELFMGQFDLPPITPTAVSEKFRQTINASRHACYSAYFEYLDWYALVMSWTQGTIDITVVPLQAADPVEERDCIVCLDITEMDEVPVQMRPSTDIAMLCTSLTNWSSHINPWHDPMGWSDANKYSLLRLLREATNLNEVDIPVGRLMYPRLTLYVFAHLKCCGSNTRLLGTLRQTLETWRLWDDLTSILNHQVMSKCLMDMLRGSQYHEESSCCILPYPSGACNDPNDLERIVFLDTIGIYTRLEAALIDQNDFQSFLLHRGPKAQSLLNLIQDLLDVSNLDHHLKQILITAIVNLSYQSRLHPECLVVKGIQMFGKHPVAYGSFGDVFKGMARGEVVAIKVLRVYQNSDLMKILKNCSREAVIWRQLSHPNVLPFYGVYYLNDDNFRIALISPWMENGNIMDYLKLQPQTDRVRLACDIASGLEYLHSLKIIHDDLKGANIFVTSSCRACLADFGLTVIRNSQTALSSATHGGTLQWQSSEVQVEDGQSTSLSSGPGGTLRYQAPELLDPNGCSQSTFASDIYSFSCVCYEMFSGEIPFYEETKDSDIFCNVLKGNRPSCPPSDICNLHGLDDEMWSIMEDCWQMPPSSRLTASQIVAYLQGRLMGIPDERLPSPPSRFWSSQHLSTFDFADLLEHYSSCSTLQGF